MHPIGSAPALAPPLERRVFPVTRSWAYCNHAAVGPLPTTTRDAVVAALDAQTDDGCAGILDVEARLEAVRADVARAINAGVDDIAFMRSTSDGALLIANGLDWREGDEIVLTDNEFGANAYPWLNLRSIGVRPILLRAPEERLNVAALERVVTARTRVVAVSYVSFNDGYRHDVSALGEWCRRNGIIFALDAIQGFGQLPLDVAASNVDVCYFGVAKWLLSPQGLSVVYVRRDLVERLRPTMCSWRSVKSPMRFLDYAQPLADGARRFDAATINYSGVIGFAESLKLLVGAGLERIERHVLALGDRFIQGAQAAGLPIISDRTPAARSGIVTVGLGKHSVDELERCGRKARVQVTIRDTGIRFAPHGYNNEEDVDRVLSMFT